MASYAHSSVCVVCVFPWPRVHARGRALLWPIRSYGRPGGENSGPIATTPTATIHDRTASTPRGEYRLGDDGADGGMLAPGPLPSLSRIGVLRSAGRLLRPPAHP